MNCIYNPVDGSCPAQEILSGATDIKTPAIWKNLVVWEQNQEIYVYDLDAPERGAQPITDGAAQPAIWEKKIVWVKNGDIFLYDYDSRVIQPITTNPAV